MLISERSINKPYRGAPDKMSQEVSIETGVVLPFTSDKSNDRGGKAEKTKMISI